MSFLLKPPYIYAHVQCRELQKGQQKIPILKKTTVLCPSILAVIFTLLSEGGRGGGGEPDKIVANAVVFTIVLHILPLTPLHLPRERDREASLKVVVAREGPPVVLVPNFEHHSARYSGVMQYCAVGWSDIALLRFSKSSVTKNR